MRKLQTILTIAFLSSIHFFHAQDTIKTNDLREIIVIEKVLSDVFRLPQIQGTDIFAGKKNEVINVGSSNADLSTNNSRQIFSKVPGLSIWENDGSGIQTGISTRGLSPNRSWEFNVRQNGYDISSEVFGYPEAYYAPPAEALQRIEIVRGAGSLQYGPQFGGLLNYVTKKCLGTKPISVESFQTIGSFGLFNSYNAIGGKINKFSYYAYMHHRSADGWRDNSQYRTRTGSVSLTYDINSKWQINGEYSHMDYVSQQAGGLTDEQFEDNARQSLRERNWFSTPWNNGALKITYSPSNRTRLTLRLFGTLAERNSVGFTKSIATADTINPNLGTYNPRQVDCDAYKNLGMELRGIQHYKLFNQSSAIAGGVRLYTGKTIRNQQGIGTTGMNYTLELIAQQNGYDFGKSLLFETQNVAVFVENLFRIADNLTITPGVRYEFIQSLASGYINTSGNGELEAQQRDRKILLLGIGGEYTTSKSTNIYGNFSQGFRPVLFSELTPSATTDVIDSNLKDASGYNADFGFRGSLFKNLIKMDIGVFRLFYDNRIGSLSVNGNAYKTNIGASVSQGVESFIEIDALSFLPSYLQVGLALFCNYSFIDAHYTRWDNPEIENDPEKSIANKKVENAPTHILRCGMTFKWRGFSSTLQFNHVGEVFTDAANTVEPNATFTTGLLPAYDVLDLNLSYQIKENYHFKAGVNNLTDTQYATRRSGGYPGPGILPGTGRTFYLTVGLRF